MAKLWPSAPVRTVPSHARRVGLTLSYLRELADSDAGDLGSFFSPVLCGQLGYTSSGLPTPCVCVCGCLAGES